MTVPLDKLVTDNPAEAGFDAARLERAYDWLARWTKEDKIPAAAICVGGRGRMVRPRFFGRQDPQGQAALRSDALFLVASITKPVTATAVMLLVERGYLRLEDRVVEYVPKFGQLGKESVQIRHLLTHTSGLPDMLPNNEKLRAAHQPLSVFIEEICRTPLLFPPGTKVSYQSMGMAMLAEVVHQISGMSLRDFLRKEIFEPLGMHDTSLGWQPQKRDRIARIRISPELEKTDWHWNSAYWLGFGAPWGGLITSPSDFARFCLMMLGQGQLGPVRILSPATVRAMTCNQLAAMPLVPEEDRRCRPWGLGWRLNWPASSANFGDLLGPRTYGHWGATGTLCWLDPDAEAFLVLFTTQPQEPEGRFLARISNCVAAALLPKT
ncbi:MAG: serine hydrolase domain-containing protein [Gemmatales bacterium]|nr:beta-lactamase family protein [Gemmatales bacterium]MDW7994366.1 serine hydrolase domain-containing protein [Gemmatales bacterium]